MSIVDYSDLSWRKGVEPGPPPQRRSGKAVLLEGPGSESYLVLGDPNIHEFHADIVERFALDYSLIVRVYPDAHDVRILTAGWRVFGGGSYNMDIDTRRLWLGGRSKAFGALPPMDAVETARSSLRGWTVES